MQMYFSPTEKGAEIFGKEGNFIILCNVLPARGFQKSIITVLYVAEYQSVINDKESIDFLQKQQNHQESGLC